MAYNFIVGYTPIATSTWDTGRDSGNINSSIFPATNTPQTDLPPLPADFKLMELWAYLNVSASHNTTIDLGVIDINTGTNSTKPLLYSASVALNGAGPGGTGWQWVGITNLNVDFTQYAGKRMAAAMGRPLDGQIVQFRFASVTPTGGWYISNRGVNYLLPNPWPTGGSAEHVSLYASFSPIKPYIETSTNVVIGKAMTLNIDGNGRPITVVPF